MGFVVFLDIDGVLNTRTTCQVAPSGYQGVDDERVKLLAKAMKEVSAEGIVLTSTWKDLKDGADDRDYLLSKFAEYGLSVLDSTTDTSVHKRGEGVLNYLKSHSEIDEFVVIDDMQFDFEDYSKIWESFLDTKGKGIENVVAASRTPSVAAMLFMDALLE